MFARKIFKMDSSIFCVWPIFSTAGPCWVQGTETTLLNMFRTTSTFSFAKRMGKNSKVRAWSKRLDTSCKSRYTHLISRMHRGTDQQECTREWEPSVFGWEWPELAHPEGRVGDHCHPTGAGVFPETPGPGVCCGFCGLAGRGYGQTPLTRPLLPLRTREQRPGSFPAPERGCPELGRQQWLPHFPMVSSALLSSSIPSSAASISNHKAFLTHRITEVGAKPTQSWSCREEELLAIMEGSNQYYCHKMSIVTTLAIFPNGLA